MRLIRFKTSTGHTWQKISKNTYLDMSTKLVWFPKEKVININHYQALELQTSKKRLPSIDEFKVAWKHGIREVFDDWEGKWFWSSTPNASDEQYAWVLYSYNGYVGYYDRSYSYNYAGARCVRGGAVASVKNV